MKMSLTKKILLLVLAAVVIIAAVVLFRSFQSSPQEHQPGSISTEEHSEQQTNQTEETNSSVLLSTDDWKAILLQAFGLDNTETDLTITNDGQMTLTGDVPKSTITNWLDSSNTELSGVMETVLSILPDSVPVTITCSMSCSDGSIVLTATKLTASSVDVPIDMVTDSVWDQVNAQLNEEVHKQIASVQSVTFQENGVLLA